ncbi:hypothetical protein BASA62_005190 [Batrachochytrium salamandrivorans]|nr:hypothetical protein BASA62_005190 [Batrachochytrium salamandrivorans]
MELVQSDAALERFDRLKVREVKAKGGQTAAAFLAEFQSTAANLQPDEKIELKMTAARENTKSLKTVLADPQANKICALRWHYNEEGDVNSVVPLLIHNCPELASLYVYSKHHSASDFVSSMLEHSSNKIKVLSLPRYTRGNIPRFFAALGQSQVSALALSIAELKLAECKFSQSNAFPKSITKLELNNCAFVGGFDWSFLADSNVRELDFLWVSGVNGNQLGDALAVHLRAKGLDELRFYDCDFVDETLAVVAVEVGRIKRLNLEESDLNDASVELIAFALKSPNNEIKELNLDYWDVVSAENYLVPALKHPNCNLVKLRAAIEEIVLPVEAPTGGDVQESKRLRVGGASNLEKGTAKLTENASALGEEVAKKKVQNTMQIDPALERFDQLRIREVYALRNQTASAFLAEFQTTAACLEPDERIKLVVYLHKRAVEFLKAVLSDPQANKICALKWSYAGYEGGTSITPLLINNCPELASLEVYFALSSAFDFVSSVLEHPSNKIKVLEMLSYKEEDSARFFAALGQSQVSALILSSFDSGEFAQGLCEYLAKDLLVRLKVWMGKKQVPSEMMMPLANCTRLTKLELIECEFSRSTVFTLPKSITKLGLEKCTFVGDFDWSFLADSNVRELVLKGVKGVNGNQLGGALAVHLRAKGLDKLHVVKCDFVNQTLAVFGIELGRIKRWEIYSNLSDASIGLIALTLQSPNNEMKELKLDYAASSIETHLVPALKHPNCNLDKLVLWAYESEHKEAAKAVEDTLRDRLALFVLLQARQVKRRYCPLRRLPVEMFRLVVKGRFSGRSSRRLGGSGWRRQWSGLIRSAQSFDKLRGLSNVGDESESAHPSCLLRQKQMEQRLAQLPQIDPALDAFDRLRVREVGAEGQDTTSAFLAKFQSIAASQGPDEKIKLEVVYTRESMESLKAVLADPQANKICSLHWWYEGREDVNSIVPLLINNCPELALLEVRFGRHFAFDFASSVLEHPSNKLKVLEMPEYTKGDIPRFFAALGQSQVSALDLYCLPKFAQGLCEYLTKDLLVRLDVWMGNKQVPSEMMMLLADCTRLTKVEMLYCKFSPPVAFTLPKSVTKLVLHDCAFVGGFDWSFLAGSKVRELNFHIVRAVGENQFGGALADHLRTKGLDKLQFYDCNFVDETLAVIGVEIGRIKRLILEGGRVSNASIELIALALQSPNSELRELVLLYDDDTARSIEDHLVPALKHPNCNLIKLSLLAYQHKVAAKAVEVMFRNRLALFALLQGQQVKRRYCPLRRLPVEMLRLSLSRRSIEAPVLFRQQGAPSSSATAAVWRRTSPGDVGGLGKQIKELSDGAGTTCSRDLRQARDASQVESFPFVRAMRSSSCFVLRGRASEWKAGGDIIR